MKLCRAHCLLLFVVAFFTIAAGLESVKAAAVPQAQQPVGATHASDIPIYVSDFDLDIVQDKTTAAPSTPSRNSSASASEPSSPAAQAHSLVQDTTKAITKALEQAGYKVHPLEAGEARPTSGMQIRGVFAESDEQSRIRRLLVGGVAVTPGMLLFVGVANLARPDQPLYQLASPPSPDPRHGPVINVTAYAPAARFELDRNPSGEDLKKIAAQVAASLTALLNANPAAAPQ